MAYDAILRDCNIEQFKGMFLSKAEYKKRMGEMSVKQMLFDKQATNALEENLRSHIVSKALITVGGGGLATTSYLLESDSSSSTAYLSYGGGRLQITAEGRDGDIGYFLRATPFKDGVQLRIESKREHYKLRTWAINVVLIIAGLLLAVIPGILLAILVIFVEPMVYRRKIEKFIVPALETTFGRLQ
jgi:hypothetical protein